MIRRETVLQRKLIQWALAYLAGGWLLLQVLDMLADAFDWPALVQQIAIVALAVGFLAVLVLAWYHGEQGRQQVTGIELLMLAGILLLAGIGVTWISADRGSGTAASAASEEVAVAEQGSIAVLPFLNMSSDPEQEYFSDGLTEELLNVLAQIPELRVAARTSAFSFKDKDVSIDSIGRALNVAHVLEGSVRRSGNTVRITAQLIDARNGFHLWSDTYDRGLEDVFAVQDEISRAIVSQLRLKLSTAGPLVRQETQDAEAHALFMRGLVGKTRGTRESLEAAVASFREAVARDPGYARAHAHLAAVLTVQRYRREIDADEGYREATAAAQRALALDPTQSEALSALAALAERADWRFAAADSLYRLSLAYAPGDARTRTLRGWLLARLGRPEEGLREAQRALQIDPLSSAAYNNAAVMYDIVGRPEQAVRMYESSLELSPRTATRANLALSLMDLGRRDEALRTIMQAYSIDSTANTRAVLGYIQAVAGHRQEAEAVLASLRTDPDASPYMRAGIHVALGETDAAFSLLDEAVSTHDDLVPDLGIDPVFRPVQGDPRFAALLARMGLPMPPAVRSTGST